MFPKNPSDARKASLPDPLESSLSPKAAAAFSASTERALRSDLCHLCGLVRRARPAAAADAAGGRGRIRRSPMAGQRAPATVRRYVTSISIVQRILGCADVTKMRDGAPLHS